MENLENLEIKANLFLQNGIVKEEFWQKIFVQLSQRMEHVAETTSRDRVIHAQDVIQVQDEAFQKKYKPLLDSMPAFPIARMSCCLAAIQKLLTSAITNSEALDDVLNFWEIVDSDMQLYIRKYPELFDKVNATIVRDFSETTLNEASERFFINCIKLNQCLVKAESWKNTFAYYIVALHYCEICMIKLLTNA